MQLKLVFLPMYFETENKLFILYCVTFRIVDFGYLSKFIDVGTFDTDNFYKHQGIRQLYMPCRFCFDFENKTQCHWRL